MKRVELRSVTGSLCEYAKGGLTEFDDRESVESSTNAAFMEIVERSRASGRTQGTRSLAEVRARLAPVRKRSTRRKS